MVEDSQAQKEVEWEEELDVFRADGRIVTQIVSGVRLYVDQHPNDPKNRAIIEFQIDKEDWLSFNAKEVSLEELGVKDFNEFYLKLKKDRKFFANIIKMFNPKAVSDNGKIDLLELLDTPSVYEVLCNNIEEMKNICSPTLVIIKYNDKIRFEIDRGPCGFSWTIERHPKKPWVTILSIGQNGNRVVSVLRYFKLEIGINKLCDFFNALVENPGRYFGIITGIGREIRFGAIEVINNSSYPGHIFEDCKYEEDKGEVDEGE
jgi:hypothetical protein